MKSLDQSAIRKQNLRQLLALLSHTPAMTRHSLAEASGLSLMTVTNLVELLRLQNVLTFTPVERQERVVGRKAENVSLCGTAHAWLVVDIGSLPFRYTLLGFDMSLLDEGTSEDCSCDAEGLTRFICTMRPRVEEALGGRELLGVALIASGPYEGTTDRITFSSVCGLSDVRIKELFRIHLGDYNYLAEQDAKYAIRSFSVLLGHADCEVLYYLYIGEGLGGAVAHNGGLMFGRNNAAGNAGQLTSYNGTPYETLLSVGAFARALGIENASDEALAEYARNHPDSYRQTLAHFAHLTAEMLRDVTLLFDPDSVLMDCRYALPAQDLFLTSVRSELERLLEGSGRILPLFSMVPPYTHTVLYGAVRALQLDWIERILA